MHSKKLEETVLWQIFMEKTAGDSERSCWVKKIYEAAANALMDVRITFQNYTLHDETHILNVMDAIGGLLGNQAANLTVGEAELLILAACLHDLGMVYTKEEKQFCYEDEATCRKFLREYCPEFSGCSSQDWPENVKQWYLRTLHPFRLPEVLQNEEWRELFDRRPSAVVPKQCILAVCQAHGEEPGRLIGNGDLEYLHAYEVDLLFCALLLRLGDLLDFDDTRAPKILYHYVTYSEESRREWDKHQASVGFCYPKTPSGNDLPYRARCANPGVEHAVRNFLDWVDDELGNCIRLQRYCREEWQREFPFPRAVLRDGIESDGYLSGDFCMTMNQTQILKLLTGENLYESPDIFVRELLQNAIDATLLRGEMDAGFVPEKARIDFGEWTDRDGNIWLRIDDQGTGMTLGMLQRYFLKVGNSYYTSKELKRDLRDHHREKNYQGISRFGIGFLSCFLCGDYVEVSTLYFDSEKNKREEAASESYGAVHYGLRMQITGLNGYYTLKSQAKHHPADTGFPAPDCYREDAGPGLERFGYRAIPGTSIAVRLNPGKLGCLNLRKAVEMYLCGARVPVYYNSLRIGHTYAEIMQAAHEMAGENIYELTPEQKRQFDRCFPAVQGQYPKIAVQVVPLDTEEEQVLPEISGVLVKYDVRFYSALGWYAKGYHYCVNEKFEWIKGFPVLILQANHVDSRRERNSSALWKKFEKKYGLEKAAALAEELEKRSEDPYSWEELGKEWLPFAEYTSIHEVCKSYYDYQYLKEMIISVWECGVPDTRILISDGGRKKITYAYQGVIADEVCRAPELFIEESKTIDYSLREESGLAIQLFREESAVFFMEGNCRPVMDVSRSCAIDFPLSTAVTISGILGIHQMLGFGLPFRMDATDEAGKRTLREWREVRNSGSGKWMKEKMITFFRKLKLTLCEPLVMDKKYAFDAYEFKYFSIVKILQEYFRAELQDSYQMTIDYEKGQIISFQEKEKDMPDVFDLFPPMMFCRAANDKSRQYLCASEVKWRRGFTLDHPFMIWLMENAARLNQYYQRQFQEIVSCLCSEKAGEIIQVCNNIREQFLILPARYGIDVNSFPQLHMNDFWLSDSEDGS